ncbi:flagellar brake protein [Desulfofalx alkaliphila]|uniref:flagellar brake protein n=1 Tax=Desulfofalx alkaliphila TaxID=105483 RepID=UPI0004E21DB0|nr:PilZ domain-containing protein [Desulfofalx alkaliphila]
MTITKYKIGQKITVTRTDGVERTEYYSSIQNIKNGVIFINVPYRGETPLVLMHNERLTIKYVDLSAAFAFESEYLGTSLENRSLRMYKIKEPHLEHIRRVQLRNFVRIPLSFDMEYRLMSSDEWYKAFMVDLSAGGLKMAARKPLPLDTQLLVFFQLPIRNEVIKVCQRAKVVRCQLADEHLNVYHLGLQFVDINRRLEDTICCFVFEKQMEQIRKR